MVKLTVEEVVEGYVSMWDPWDCQYVGPMGLGQVLMVSLTWIFDAHSTLVIIFTDAQLPPSASCGSGKGLFCNLERVDGHRTVVGEWNLTCAVISTLNFNFRKDKIY